MKKEEKMNRPLTEKEELFVESFIGDGRFDPLKAYEAAGYSYTYKPYSEAMTILKRPAVIREITERIANPQGTPWINKGTIVQRLWEEATKEGRGSTHAGRINALVWIGKHLGMWQDKEAEKEKETSIQIIQYGVPEEKMKETIENIPEVEKKKDSVKLPEGVVVVDYNDGKTH